MTKHKVSATESLYIKLGRGGQWEDQCIREGTLRLGYRETPHNWCANGDWVKVKAERLKAREGRRSAATSDVNQIRKFYESPSNVLWITFHKHSLWWCRSNRKIEKLDDESKTRPTIGQWNNKDVNGDPLIFSRLSGALLAIAGFQGTIAKVKEHEYLIKKINGLEDKRIAEAGQALRTLESRLEPLIQSLTWQDFETLIDLIFRQAGWLRVGDVGKTTKSIDLELISPITSERYGVQIKAKANARQFQTYIEKRLKNMQGFSRSYFVVHTPMDDLKKHENEEVKLLLPSDIGRLATRYGLAPWIIDKAR